MSKPVRTRFAPSPTGFMHVGGIRTALFSWLVARKANGQFILRLEDTDKKREEAGADQHIIDSLRALGLDYDEGPDTGGPYAPYRQSERLESYQKWARKLIQADRAYADPYTPEEVQAFRDEAQAAKKPFLYRNHRPASPADWDGKRPLRFKSDPKAHSWHDEVMGKISIGPEAVDDFILIKSDGFPTYNFSHIVDDIEMKITHVIRGQEFLASIPNYLNLYEALELSPPKMATVPHILGPDGKKKLSKRDGANDVLEYIKDGYLPEALINFIATLGWNDGTEQEIFSIDELVAKFSLKRVQRSGAKFDEQRLIWMNGHYLRGMEIGDLYERARGFWPEAAKGADEKYKKLVLKLVQERLKYLAELPGLTEFFFKRPEAGRVRELYDDPVDKQLKKLDLSPEKYREMLRASHEELASSDFSKPDIAQRLNDLLQQLNSKPAVLFPVIRIAISGQAATPELAGTLHVIGKEESLKRLDAAISALEK